VDERVTREELGAGLAFFGEVDRSVSAARALLPLGGAMRDAANEEAAGSGSGGVTPPIASDGLGAGVESGGRAAAPPGFGGEVDERVDLPRGGFAEVGSATGGQAAREEASAARQEAGGVAEVLALQRRTIELLERLVGSGRGTDRRAPDLGELAADAVARRLS
jgi:hypothetical protein